MSTREALALPPGSEALASVFERDAGYRRRYVRQLVLRLFPSTLGVVKEIEGQGTERFEEASSKLCVALRVISVHEQPHFARRVGDEVVPSSAVDGLYVACRGLAAEVLFRGSANKDVLDRLAASWCTTMRLLMAYDVTSNNRSLKSICARSRQWMRRCVDSAVDGYVTWPFWKAIRACLNWCCMFHAENDYGCSFGSPRFGRLLAELARDPLLVGLPAAIMSYTFSPYVVRSDLVPRGPGSRRGRQAPRRATGADPEEDSDDMVVPDSDDSDEIRVGTAAGFARTGRDEEGRPVAVVRPICSWVECARTEVPDDVFDGPPFDDLSPLANNPAFINRPSVSPSPPGSSPDGDQRSNAFDRDDRAMGAEEEDFPLSDREVLDLDIENIDPMGDEDADDMPNISGFGGDAGDAGGDEDADGDEDDANARNVPGPSSSSANAPRQPQASGGGRSEERQYSYNNNNGSSFMAVRSGRPRGRQRSAHGAVDFDGGAAGRRGRVRSSRSRSGGEGGSDGQRRYAAVTGTPVIGRPSPPPLPTPASRYHHQQRRGQRRDRAAGGGSRAIADGFVARRRLVWEDGDVVVLSDMED